MAILLKKCFELQKLRNLAKEKEFKIREIELMKNEEDEVQLKNKLNYSVLAKENPFKIIFKLPKLNLSGFTLLDTGSDVNLINKNILPSHLKLIIQIIVYWLQMHRKFKISGLLPRVST